MATASAALLDLAALRRVPVQEEPYPYLIVPGFLPPTAVAAISADFPRIEQGGSFPIAELNCGPAFRAFVGELEGAGLRTIMAEKFALDLAGRPTMITVRGQARAGDGRIHADARSKLITVLIYMNEDWREDAGRLRLLRSAADLEDYAAEVPPSGGALLVFRRSERSWHGHKPTSGPRRAVQLNWVTSQAVVDHEQGRHRISTKLKKFRNLFMPSSAA